MKVGDYVRTDKGLIGKYNIKKEYITVPLWQGGSKTEEQEIKYIDDMPYNISTHTIVKSSPKIIDLIREGDLVNNHIVGQVFYENQTIDNIKYLDLEGVNILVCNDDIKSIITREQFESMKYKVKE